MKKLILFGKIMSKYQSRWDLSMKIFKQSNTILSLDRCKDIQLNIVQYKIVHYNLTLLHKYIHKQSLLKNLLFYLKLNPKLYICIHLTFAQISTISTNQTKTSLLLYLLKINLFILQNYFETWFLTIYLKQFAFLRLIAHIIP